MITIIHGTDIANSRKYFFDQKERFPDAELFSGEKLTLTDLAQILEGGGLFMEQKTIFIENFFHKKKNKTEFKALAEYIQKHTDAHSLFLWEGKELERSAFTLFKTAVPKVFKLPQTLFLFLDNIRPGNGQQLIKLFHQTVATTDAEMVFFMLVRQIRFLLAAKDPQMSEIDELKRMQPWQKTKLQKQASLFTPKQLQQLYQQLFSLEVAQKTGTLSNSILTNIDFLLLGI